MRFNINYDSCCFIYETKSVCDPYNTHPHHTIRRADIVKNTVFFIFLVNKNKEKKVFNRNERVVARKICVIGANILVFFLMTNNMKQSYYKFLPKQKCVLTSILFSQNFLCHFVLMT